MRLHRPGRLTEIEMDVPCLQRPHLHSCGFLLRLTKSPSPHGSSLCKVSESSGRADSTISQKPSGEPVWASHGFWPRSEIFAMLRLRPLHLLVAQAASPLVWSSSMLHATVPGQPMRVHSANMRIGRARGFDMHPRGLLPPQFRARAGGDPEIANNQGELHSCTAARLHGCTAARLHGGTAANNRGEGRGERGPGSSSRGCECA